MPTTYRSDRDNMTGRESAQRCVAPEAAFRRGWNSRPRSRRYAPARHARGHASISRARNRLGDVPATKVRSPKRHALMLALDLRVRRCSKEDSTAGAARSVNLSWPARGSKRGWRRGYCVRGLRRKTASISRVSRTGQWSTSMTRCTTIPGGEGRSDDLLSVAKTRTTWRRAAWIRFVVPSRQGTSCLARCPC